MTAEARFQTGYYEGPLEGPGIALDQDGSVKVINPDGSRTLLGPALRGPFPVAFNTPGVNAGVVIYTPKAGEVLLDAWFEVLTAFDGTTPQEIGTFLGTTSGLFGNLGSPPDLSQADSTVGTGGVLTSSFGTNPSLVLAGAQGGGYFGRGYGRFTTDDPLKAVVSRNGEQGGAAVGGSHGAAHIYLVTAAPTT